MANDAVARRAHVTRQTVGRWRARFLADRLDGLLDEPRPGAPRKIGDAEVEQVLTRTAPDPGQLRVSVQGEHSDRSNVNARIGAT
jgi:transposase